VNRRVSVIALLVALAARTVETHSGPPFPIVSDQQAGPYVVSIWTDPDTTDNGAAGGQFWIRVHPAAGGVSLPPVTRVSLAVAAAGGHGPGPMAAAAPVRGDVTNQFTAVVLGHEGRFDVVVDIAGPLGAATVTSAVDATYDLRPPKALFLLYLLPFVLVGLLWGRLLIRRRAGPPPNGRR
jgi:hypothetical protein